MPSADAAEPLFPLVIIGPMAAGKTKIGRRVARVLELPFIDTDKRIAVQNGPISEIFDREGEDYFRVLEREAVVEALAEEAVVSLGGGAVLHVGTQADLAEASVVLLTVSAEAVQRRLSGSGRPLLDAESRSEATERWQRILDERMPVYESLADVRFDTSSRPIAAIADDIVAWVRGRS
ncbi:shikimate kinase [Luethyella okanaganae]|uniref:Shikimate kinase n=1 Tax=Luethyella okanaganae TaxID=69372 RepID=A0ABW1VBU6_9MICO